MLVINSVIYNYSKKNKVLLITTNDSAFKELNIKIIKISKTLFNRFLLKFLTNSWHSNIIGIYGDFPRYNRLLEEYQPYREALFRNRKDVLNKIKKENFPLEPKIIFSKDELAQYKKNNNKIIGLEYGVIIPMSYRNGEQTVKSISFKKIQNIINHTKKKINWIQIGTKDEPLLNNVIDKRGIPIREAFFIVSRGTLAVTPEGMLNHLSAAFNLPCLTFFTGFSNPKNFKYKNTIAFLPQKLPSCAFCYNHICKVSNSNKAYCAKYFDEKKIINKIESIINKKNSRIT